MMFCEIILLFLQYLQIINAGDIVRTASHRHGLFIKRYSDKYLSYPALTQHQVINMQECALFCVRNNQCKSFNLYIVNTPILCDLLPKDSTDSPDFISAAGFKYYETGEIS